MITMKKQHIPNYITAFRIALVPAYVLLFLGVGTSLGRYPCHVISGIIIVISSISDIADGILARRNNWVSDLGKLLDPLADKLIELSVAICFAIEFGGAFIVLASITVVKELIMIIGSFVILRHRKFTVSSAWFGKATTVLWSATVILVSFVPSEPPYLWPNVLCIALIVFMVFAFVMYVIRYFDSIIKIKNGVEQKPKVENASLKEAEESK